MKLSYKQLSTYLPVPLSVERTAEILTLTGLEVEDIFAFETVKGGLKGLVVGQVVEKDKHPDADRLSLTKVDIGTGTLLDIVCGAPNVAAGQKVIVATVGATLYPVNGEPFSIKKSKIRGAVSEGMICAEDEIGLGESHAGIMVLPEDTPVGMPAAEYFRIETDTVIETNITPNRPDAASHIGSARDIIAYLGIEADGLQLNLPDVSAFKTGSNAGPVQVEIENTEACPRYSGLYLKNVKVGESPGWLKNFLLATGLRPINNVVDITNFVLMETGQPLHAFDADAITGNKVIVKTCAEGTPFVTLDGTERKLGASDLVICNASGPMCIAGVFGGLHSGTTEKTVNVFLESAYFNPSWVRRTSKSQGLKTDSSFRFERGTDPEGTLYALKRAALLMQEICGAEPEGAIVDVYPVPVPERVISLRKEKIASVSGMEIPGDICKKILTGLGIEIRSESSEAYEVRVPLFKTDVTREIDLVEELVRVYGLNNVPLNKTIGYTPGLKGEREAIRFYKKTAAYLSAGGFSEILTNSLIHSKNAALMTEVKEEEWVKVINPISSELDIMRPTLLFSGLDVVARNRNHKNPDLRLFEMANTYKAVPGKPDQYVQEEKLCLWISGAESPESWRNPATPSGFYTLKAAVDGLFQFLGLEGHEAAEYQDSVMDHGLAYTSKKAGTLAVFGHIRPKTAEAMDIKADVWYAELDVKKLQQPGIQNVIRFREIPKYPSVRRDLALVVSKDVKYTQLEDIARKKGKKLLRGVNLFDVYEGKNLPEGTRSYALSYIFMSEEGTLTDETIDGLMKELIGTYESELGARLR